MQHKKISNAPFENLRKSIIPTQPRANRMLLKKWTKHIKCFLTNLSKEATIKREVYLIVADSRTPQIIIVRPIIKDKIVSRAKLTTTIVGIRENKDGKIAIFENSSCTTFIEHNKMTFEETILSQNAKNSNNNSEITLDGQPKDQTKLFGNILKQPNESRHRWGSNMNNNKEDVSRWKENTSNTTETIQITI